MNQDFDNSAPMFPPHIKLQLEAAKKSVIDGCGSCIHASWGRSEYEQDDFYFTGCKAGLRLTQDKSSGAQLPLAWCSEWNKPVFGSVENSAQQAERISRMRSSGLQQMPPPIP